MEFGQTISVGHSTVGEPELLLQKGVSFLSTFHVLIHLGHGYVKLEVVEEDGSAEQAGEDGKGGIFKLRQHDLHRTQLHTPVHNRTTDRWRLPTDTLPIRRLYILQMKLPSNSDFKMFRSFGIIFIGIVIISDQGIANE